MIVTLVILRFQLRHAALAVFYGVHRSAITRAVGEIRPLLAQRGFAVPGQPGLRLQTLADVFGLVASALTGRAARLEISTPRTPQRGRCQRPSPGQPHPVMRRTYGYALRSEARKPG